MRPVDILIAARAKIADPKHWTQGSAARNSNGAPTLIDIAVCWCAWGAMLAVADTVHTPAEANNMLVRAMGSPVATFNDTHTHAEVLAAFDKAIHENS